MKQELLESQRKSILKILEEHSNSNLASQAARDVITQEIISSFPKRRLFRVNVGTIPMREAVQFMERIRTKIEAGEDLNIFARDNNFSIEEEITIPAHSESYIIESKE